MMLSAVALLTACGDEAATTGAKAGAPTTMQVEGFEVTAKPFNSTVTVTAELQPNEQVQLMAPMAAQVLDIYFEEGQKVQEGDAIVRLDDRSWKAQLTGLRAELNTATRDLERKQALLAIEGSTQEEIDQLTSSIETLRAQIQQLEINIDLANVTAPFSGRLGMRNFSKGAYLKAGDVITTLSSTSELKVDFSIPQEHRKSISVGSSVQLVVLGDTVPAKVYAIDPVINATSRTLNVRAKVRTGDGNVMPGAFAEVQVATDLVKDALLVPTQAVVPEINDQTVFIAHNGKVERKVVELGGRTADLVHVRQGVSGGDTIITTGLLSIKPGMGVQVQIINP